MAFPKLLLSIFVLIIATSASIDVIAKRESLRAIDFLLPDYVKPMHYNIKLMLRDDENFNGESNITVSISLATQYIRFHSHQIDINHQTIAVSNKVTEMVYKPAEYSYNFNTHVNTLYFDEELQPEIYTLYVKFTGFIANNDGNEEGFLRTSYVNELHKEGSNWLLATYSRAIGTRRVFPCWDEPASRATFNISIKHRKDWRAFSNSPVLQTRVDADGEEWTHFSITPALPTHAVWIIVLDMPDFSPVESLADNVTILCEKHTCASNIQLAYNIIENVTMFLRTLKVETTNPYHAIVPDYNNRITENWAVAFYRKKDVAYNDQMDSIVRKIEIANLVALKTTRQWFVNVINPSQWSYFWLNDALSRWIATLVLDKIMPDLRIMDLFVVRIQHEFLYLDIDSLLIPLTVEINKPSEINSLLTFHHYSKASVILRMLYYILTPEVFWNGLQIFVNTHELTSATPDDLWDAMQSALNNSNTSQSMDFDLKILMNGWVREKNYPTLDVKQDYKTGNVQIQILSINDPAPSRNNQFVPITYATRTNPHFNQIWLNKTKWLKPTESSLNVAQIPLDDWIIINAQQAGYYRVKYDERNWRRLARYLKTCEYNKIHVLNRAQIIDDAFHFLMEGHLELPIFIELTQYLKQETDYVVWYPMFKAFEYMSGYLPFPGITTIKEHMRHILSELLNNLGFNEPDEDSLTTQLRQEAIKWACTIGAPQCRAIEVNHYFEQLPEQQFSLGWNRWSHCAGLMFANVSDWDRMISIWERNYDSRILESLVCSEDPNIIYKHSKLFMSTNYLRKIRNRDHIRVFFNIVARHVKNDNVLSFLLENFDKVKPRKVSAIAALTVMINYVYSKKQLSLIMNCAKTEVMNEQYMEIQSKIKTRVSEIERHLEYFQYLSK